MSPQAATAGSSMEMEEEEEISPPTTASVVMASEIQKGPAGGPVYTCTICSASFEKVSTLNKHIRAHAKDKVESA